MKNFFLIGASTLLLAVGCSKEKPVVHPEPPVAVHFRMEAAIDTYTSVEPMTRVTAYVSCLSSQCRALILKKNDGRWIVDRTQTIMLDADPVQHEMMFTGDMPPCSFGFEMRPGDYRIVAVINPNVAQWNEALTPGTVVADEKEPLLGTPPLLTYTVSTHWANAGYRMLTREVFVAVADFTVPKSGDLHGSGMRTVALRAERRVGKFRFLLKDKPSPQYKFTFERTAHTFRGNFTAERPFAEGIDALGGMYYSEQELRQLPWCMSTLGDYHHANNADYQLCQINSTVFSPFLFVDPAQEEQPFEISDISISGASGGFVYRTDRVFSRTLAASKITGIVFQTNDQVIEISPQLTVGIDVATDEKGEPENAARIFDPFFEWNAPTD